MSQLPKPYIAVLDGITSMSWDLTLPLSSSDVHFNISGRWCRSWHWRTLQDSDGEDRICDARNQDRILSRCRGKLFPVEDGWGVRHLSRLDVGHIGWQGGLVSAKHRLKAITYLVGSELGLATHYVPSRTIPSLMNRLAEYENPSLIQINGTIEELHSERQPDEPSGKLMGAVRNALDSAFRHNSVEKILESLATLSSSPDTRVSGWAKQTLETLHMRSPTSLKVALAAIRRGGNMSLRDALQMEMGIATAYCVSHIPPRSVFDVEIQSFCRAVPARISAQA